MILEERDFQDAVKKLEADGFIDEVNKKYGGSNKSRLRYASFSIAKKRSSSQKRTGTKKSRKTASSFLGIGKPAKKNNVLSKLVVLKKNAAAKKRVVKNKALPEKVTGT